MQFLTWAVKRVGLDEIGNGFIAELGIGNCDSSLAIIGIALAYIRDSNILAPTCSTDGSSLVMVENYIIIFLSLSVPLFDPVSTRIGHGERASESFPGLEFIYFLSVL